MAGKSLRIVLWSIFWASMAVVAGFGLVITIQGARFERQVRQEARALLGSASQPPAPPGGARLLPPPVQRYLQAAGALAHAPVRAVRLRHAGTFRPSADARPLAIRGEQYLTSDPPGFVWWGRVRVAPGLWIDARDRSIGGEGSMLVRAVSSFTLADARGAALDAAALQRLLGELAWMPTALVDPRWVRWEPLDDWSAVAHLAVGGRDVSLIWRFGPDGLPLRVAAVRGRDVDGRVVPTPWEGEFGGWREVDGLRVPFRLAATWTVDGAPLTYARWEVEAVEPGASEPW